MVPNLLLLLSTSVPPYPRDEVHALAGFAREQGVAFLVHTRTDAGLIADESEIALYADGDLGPTLLAWATFAEYVPFSATERAAAIHEKQESLYRRGVHMPSHALGFFGLRDIELAVGGTPLASLGGYLDDALSVPLTASSLPRENRSFVAVRYFREGAPLA